MHLPSKLGPFTVEERLGSGGAGEVYRGRDEEGRLAAIKVLLKQDRSTRERFRREADMLARLDHPGIVRYVGRGSAGPRPFLAMEWLDGVTLRAHLDRTRIPTGDALELLATLADALAYAHDAGIAHRDVKPDNVVLRGGETHAPVLVDFGIARDFGEASQLTQTGMIVGTPRYLAPEQARGARGDAASDLFALGVLAFEALTGSYPFDATDFGELVLKLVLEPSPRLRDRRPDLPRALDELVGRLLEKEPEARPDHAQSVARQLRAAAFGLADTTQIALPKGSLQAVSGSSPVASPGISAGERRWVALVLIEMSGAEGPTLDLDARLGRIAGRAGGLSMQLVTGARCVHVAGRGLAQDRACSAARLALDLKAVVPGARFALVCAPSEAAPLAHPETLHEAVQLVRRAEAGTIAVHPSMLPWLARRFVVEAGSPARLGREAPAWEGRSVLGRSVPFVGRQASLQQLLELDRSSEPRVGAIVFGASGLGKSRLRRELMGRMSERSPDATILVAACDSTRVRAGFTWVRFALRRAMGLSPDRNPADASRALSELLSLTTTESADDGLVQGIARLAGVDALGPVPPSHTYAADEDELMFDLLIAAWVEWLKGVCSRGSVQLIVDDAQWIDPASLRAIDAALWALRGRPFSVIAFARPEAQPELTTRLRHHPIMTLELGPLRDEDIREAAAQVLGCDPADDRAVRVAARADGNPFFLEEVLRAELSGAAAFTPAAIVATIQTRLEALRPELRRLARASAVFPDSFSLGAVAAILSEPRPDRVLAWLTELIAADVLTPFEGQSEPRYQFRHALIRDAALGTLTEADRCEAHRAAATYLQSRELDVEPIVIAEHLRAAGDSGTAAGWFARAAQRARAADDTDAVLGAGESALEAGLAGELKGHLLLSMAEAHAWRAQNRQMLERAQSAAAHLTPDTGAGLRARLVVAFAHARLGNVDPLRAIPDSLLQRPASTLPPEVLTDACKAVQYLNLVGEPARAEALLTWLADALEPPPDGAGVRPQRPARGVSPALYGRFLEARSGFEKRRGNLALSMQLLGAARACYARAGQTRAATAAQMHLGYAATLVGRWKRAAEELEQALEGAVRAGLTHLIALCKHNLGHALAHLGETQRGLSLEHEALALYREAADARMIGGCYTYLSAIHRLAGEIDEAARWAERSVQQLETFPVLHISAQAELVTVRATQGDATSAIAIAERLAAQGPELGPEAEAIAACALARALAAGSDPRAPAAIAQAWATLKRNASALGSDELAASYLEAIPEHAEVCRLMESAAEPLT